MKHNRNRLYFALCCLGAFVLWTGMICCVDVQPIGPLDSCVGLAGINQRFHRLTGVHFDLYTLTDWLGLVPVGTCGAFGVLGLAQWIKRKSLCKVDRTIFLLGVFYVITAVMYLLFERIVINYRPVLINGKLEASYPSSTTMLAMCVMPTAVLQLMDRIKSRLLRIVVSYGMYAFTAFMVLGRLVSGVHWLTDVVGGVLLSMGLVSLYAWAHRACSERCASQRTAKWKD